MNKTNLYLLPVEDGLLTRESGRWAEEKLDYLKRYIDVFATSMRKKWRKRNYIDLFAGPGKCKCRETNKVLLGSPILAITANYPFTNYIFVDSNKENTDALNKRIQASNQILNSRILNDNANEVINNIVDNYISDDSLNLAFLDPEGLELCWRTVEKLSRKRVDMIIHYPQMGITRYMPNAVTSKENTSIDYFFGDRKWRDIYRKYKSNEQIFIHRKLMDYYMKKLRQLGYQDTQFDKDLGIQIFTEPSMKNVRNAPLYRLIFASKNKLGKKFWGEITKRDVHGQKRLF
jgi:three-Cys-motif partner protein